MKRAIRLAFIVIVLAVCVAAWWLRAALFSPIQGTPAWRLVTVPQGTSLRGLATILQEQQLISPAGRRVFILAGIVTHKGQQLKPGRYRLSPSMSPWRIMDEIQAGHVYLLRITVPEGYTLKQIAVLLAEKGVGTEQEFLDATRDSQAIRTAFPSPHPTLEGYVFPDTYRITGTEGAQGVAKQMVQRFTDVVWRGVFRGKVTAGGLTLHQAVTLASLVEGEARVPAERPIIAGVLLNRLHQGMRLECDATVQYALGERHACLLNRDLDIDSPYNTYRHAGLPPGPICNPGKASIEAAIHPKVTPYLFYVAKGDGSHVFTRTFNEHLAAIARIRRAR